jgi:hypothetical protein
MAGTITVGELLSDPSSSNKITIGTGTTLDLVSGAGSVIHPPPVGMDDVSGVARATSGLLFNGDTASGNALDDYEEGTWTPGFMLGSPTYGPTVYNRTGRYTKTGNVCHVWCELYMPQITYVDSTQVMQIGPLPYAAGDSATFGTALGSSVQLNNIWTDGSTYNTLGAGNTSFIHFNAGIGATNNYFTIDISAAQNIARGRLKNAAFHDGSGLAVGLSYRTS